MTKYTLAVLVVGLLPAAPAPDLVRKDQEALQGTWAAVAVEAQGEDKDGFGQFLLIFDGDTLTIQKCGQVRVQGTFKLDPYRTPKAIDLRAEGAGGQDSGPVVHGIYELGRDGLKWSFLDPGDRDRPGAFATAAGGKNVTVTFKRIKE